MNVDNTNITTEIFKYAKRNDDSSTSSQTFVVELASTQWRTTLVAGLGMCFNIGVVSTYVCGAFLHWRTLAYISCIPPVAAFTVALTVPESAPWLVTKGTFFIRNIQLKHIQVINTTP